MDLLADVGRVLLFIAMGYIALLIVWNGLLIIGGSVWFPAVGVLNIVRAARIVKDAGHEYDKDGYRFYKDESVYARGRFYRDQWGRPLIPVPGYSSLLSREPRVCVGRDRRGDARFYTRTGKSPRLLPRKLRKSHPADFLPTWMARDEPASHEAASSPPR